MRVRTLHYEFEPKEKIGTGFVRILDEISSRAKELGRSSEGSLTDAVHDARVLGKRLRALLWFGRSALAGSAYREAKAKLRKASSLLSRQRDRTVVRSILGKLAKKAKPRDFQAAAKAAEKISGLEPSFDEERKTRIALQRAMAMLRRAITQLKKSAVTHRRWPKPSVRVEKAGHQMTNAGRKARRSGQDGAYHEWRKKAKRFLYELELVDPGARQTIRRVDQLQEELGSLHDATVVEMRLRWSKPQAASIGRALNLLSESKARSRRRANKIRKRI